MMHTLQRTFLISTFLALWYCQAYADQDHRKRAPSGFFGMRGKKSISDSEYETIEDNVVKETEPPGQASQGPPLTYNTMDKRAPHASSFVGMRGKKPWSYPEELYKRAPQGFFGMRGKKDNGLDEDYFDGYPKRAPMGFFGMRGKKYVWQPYFQDEKRAPNGFFGVRGKKDFKDLFYEEDKRAPQSFFGVRGKRMGFYGVRGKKIPYQFRGKFVGVRGKKSSEPSLLTAENQSTMDYLTDSKSKLSNNLEWNQLMLLLTEQGETGISNEIKSP